MRDIAEDICHSMDPGYQRPDKNTIRNRPNGGRIYASTVERGRRTDALRLSPARMTFRCPRRRRLSSEKTRRDRWRYCSEVRRRVRVCRILLLNVSYAHMFLLHLMKLCFHVTVRVMLTKPRSKKKKNHETKTSISVVTCWPL